MIDNIQDIEQVIRSAWDRKDFDRAATVAIREYGPEILGVLAARMRSESDAHEIFSLFCEDLWRGLSSFRWQCTAKVWAYTVALHAANRYANSAHRKRKRNLPLSQVGHLSQIIDSVRSSTLNYLRTEVKSRMRQLREQLPTEEQELLILRVDKQLSWRDLAIVHFYPGSLDNEQELQKCAARLRKRFQKAKGKLRLLAERAGMTGNHRR